MASESQDTDLFSGISNFGLNFYQECAQSKPGDVIISPLLVASSLALLAQGADGNTFEELRKGLYMTADKSIAANQFAEYYETLQESVGESTLSIANKIYVQIGHPINKNFKEVAVKKFRSGIGSLDFTKADESANAINRFVGEKTKNKIKDLIKPDLLNDLTRMILVNAIYFKGNWEYPFEKKYNTKGDFYISESDTVPVDFMHIKELFNYAVLKDLDATALAMEYAFSKLSFVIVLPNSRTGLYALESKLKSYGLAKIINQMREKIVKVTIPKFKVEFEINLNDVLKKMGLSEMFTRQANLSGLLDTTEDLYVSNMVHKAFIEVNEEGSEAVATAAMLFGGCGPTKPAVFKGDHPFLYFIMDTTKMSTIFIGSFKNI